MIRSWQRVYAVLIRHLYILRGSKARLIEIIYWPSVQMILWGFISRFFATSGAAGMGSKAFGVLLGAVLLWDMLFRTQLGVTLSYLEEVWARNLGHLFVSPLRPYEWWFAMMIFSILRALAGMLPAALLAIPFYGYSIFDLGLPLLFLFFNLMFMGWWLGFLIMALLLKAGQGAETMAWALTFFLAPFCAVYYPISALPGWLQPVANAMPAAHVFEGLRGIVNDGVFQINHMWAALALNIVYMAVSMFVLQLSFNSARKAGTLLQSGE
ncbi:MAG TPA: ABC transporter permease [Patescibacteria group bacterium]|nr:ABC transporter permease [Patescibacteria group bacterium]